MLSVVRVFYADDILSSLVYLTFGGLKLVAAIHQNNHQRRNDLSVLHKKILKKNHRNICGLAKICSVVEKSGSGFYLTTRDMCVPEEVPYISGTVIIGCLNHFAS